MIWRKPTDPINLLSPPVLAGSLAWAGFSPVMRGTCGSAVAALAIWLANVGADGMLWIALALGVASIVFGEWAIRSSARHADPDWFVLDEAAAVALILGLTGSSTVLDFCFAFAVFRFYDIAKPWPVSVFEHLPRSAGILMDDLAAACLGAWTIWSCRLLVSGALIG